LFTLLFFLFVCLRVGGSYLYGRVAQQNGGGGRLQLDWAPHLPWLLTVLQQLFKLPVGAAQATGPAVTEVLDKEALSFLPQHWTGLKGMAVLLAHAATPRNGVLAGLRSVLAVCTSFLHPSNHGLWAPRISSFLFKLGEQWAGRLRDERAATCKVCRV
jgi:hypothetical protein